MDKIKSSSTLTLKKGNGIFILNLFFVFISFAYIMWLDGFKALIPGHDTWRYALYFKSIHNFHSMNVLAKKQELLAYAYFMGFIKIFIYNYHNFVPIYTLVAFLFSLFIYINFAKVIGVKLWGMYLLFLFFSYEITFYGNIEREIIAMLLVFLSFYYSVKRKILIAIFVICIAILFNMSAIAFIPLIFILNYNKLDFRKKPLFIIIILLLFSLMILTFGYYLSYNIGELIKFIHFNSSIYKVFVIKYTYYIDQHLTGGTLIGRTIFSIKNMDFMFFLIVISIFLLKNNFLSNINFYFFILFIIFYQFPQIDVSLILPYYMFILPFIIRELLINLIKNKTYSYMLLFGFFLGYGFLTLITFNHS